MIIALKIFAAISAIGIAYFDYSVISSFAEFNYDPFSLIYLITYNILPMGILLALFYASGFLNNKIFKKIIAVIMMSFSSLHIIFKLLHLCDSLLTPNGFATFTEVHLGFLWASQIILLTAVFVLGLSSFIPKLQKVSAYILIVGVLAYLLSDFYLIYAGGYALEQLFAESDISFIIPQILVLIGYIGVFFKEVWIENELFK